jgi:hypothetical protein
MPTDDAVKFDPNTIAEKIRARIRHATLDVIPKATLRALIVDEVARFTTDRVERDRFGHQTAEPAALRAVVTKELDTAARAMVAAYLASPDGAALLTTRLIALTQEVAPQVLTELLRDAMHRLVYVLMHRG